MLIFTRNIKEQLTDDKEAVVAILLVENSQTNRKRNRLAPEKFIQSRATDKGGRV